MSHAPPRRTFNHAHLYPSLGFGLGLRVDHYETILNDRPAVDWFEALTENYLVPGGKPLHHLMRIREHYPMVMHGVSLSIGSAAALDRAYLAAAEARSPRASSPPGYPIICAGPESAARTCTICCRCRTRTRL